MKKNYPKRLTIKEVEKETNYVLVVSTNAYSNFILLDINLG